MTKNIDLTGTLQWIQATMPTLAQRLSWTAHLCRMGIVTPARAAQDFRDVAAEAAKGAYTARCCRFWAERGALAARAENRAIDLRPFIEMANHLRDAMNGLHKQAHTLARRLDPTAAAVPITIVQ